MTEKELLSGYQTEISYQKHMIANLKRWFSSLFIVSSLGVVALYFSKVSLLLRFSGIGLVIIGCLGMLLFGYGIYKGQQNVNRVIDDLQTKLAVIHQKR
ncbi:DUF202 domain-containing protein [Streptococcus sciuri]|uniref:DUF202 domain-containing protein n=1 Tax=Streptococcus sciuri TaxID=2973939 RepID=A0ABT2F5X3_9STRE|nr:DUF202 domain-containing protein [Streptococcus sciuri]MCS4487881.1 DUF202 domain-containing protein [Streptococcus sciuri]